MEKLPVTSYIRLVDVWLIFGQLIPFIQVRTELIFLPMEGIFLALEFIKSSKASLKLFDQGCCVYIY